jgi:hypothetical protein
MYSNQILAWLEAANRDYQELQGTITIGGEQFPTTAGAGNDDFLVGITGNFNVKEL